MSLYKGETHRNRHKEGHVKKEAETGYTSAKECLLTQTKEFLGLPEGGRGKEGAILILDLA